MVVTILYYLLTAYVAGLLVWSFIRRKNAAGRDLTMIVLNLSCSGSGLK